MMHEFEKQCHSLSSSFNLRLTEQSQKIHQLKNLVQIYRSTNENVSLLKNTSTLKIENAKLKQKVSEMETEIEVSLKNNCTIHSVKE